MLHFWIRSSIERKGTPGKSKLDTPETGQSPEYSNLEFIFCVCCVGTAPSVSQISYFNLPTWPTRPENSSARGFVIWLAALSVHRFPTKPEAVFNILKAAGVFRQHEGRYHTLSHIAF